MKNKIKIAILVLAVVVLSFLYAHISKNTYLYDRSSGSEDFVGTGIIKEGEEITQGFISKEELLDGINLKATVNGNVENVVLTYTLRDNETGEEVHGSVKGAEVKNNKFNAYTFDRVEQAKGKSYTLVLTETGSDENNGISFYYSPQEQTEGDLIVKGESAQGVLAARTITDRFDLETFIVLLGFVAFVVGFIKVLYKLFK
ncbi:MAG: hypothetical protein MSA90_10545 [Faecalicatena sp.]|uniref:hypothetical protein n=1 Tax=Faecalicatena sp. TaxID=2005360 RepID=UPI00258A9779|nr:hypothetical protein [Faecalicatena sp.]MCI6465891.1 hypothetical protein [Faecalicatena sp.]MDY5618693.1 hypothetical protein [Lachnospiraceae bacterium]